MAGSLQSLCWASAAAGGIASAYFSGYLVEAWGPRGVFGATAIFPLIICGSALLINEEAIKEGKSKGVARGEYLRFYWVFWDQAVGLEL